MSEDIEHWQVLTSFHNMKQLPSNERGHRMFILDFGPHLTTSLINNETVERECSAGFNAVSSMRELSRILSEFADSFEHQIRGIYFADVEDDRGYWRAKVAQINSSFDMSISKIEQAVKAAEEDLPDDEIPRRVEFP